MQPFTQKKRTHDAYVLHTISSQHQYEQVTYNYALAELVNKLTS